jgi:hypothetical protein
MNGVVRGPFRHYYQTPINSPLGIPQGKESSAFITVQVLVHLLIFSHVQDHAPFSYLFPTNVMVITIHIDKWDIT